jgi:hypothetical protein
MTYKPAPIDTSTIILSHDILELTERLARNAHENWSMQRIAEGWTYGYYRDDKKKQHPSLIEYEKLPESEKEYDRITAMETLKAIIALGYTIIKF